MNQSKNRAKERWAMLPVIFALAWPTMLEELMQTLVQYIDTAMVGALGTEATAAVGATSTVGWMVGSSVSALGIGFLAYIAKACGAGQDQKAHRASAQAALMVCIVGTLFTALPTQPSPRLAFAAEFANCILPARTSTAASLDNARTSAEIISISTFLLRPFYGYFIKAGQNKQERA